MSAKQDKWPPAVAAGATDKAKVLLVDDDPINLQVLFQALDGHGYQLLAARSGDEALKIAQQVQPALILLDVQMPGIDGYETCRRLKAAPATCDAAIIFLTALQETHEKVRGLSLGAVDFITKPFDAREVLARVARQVEVQDGNRKLREKNRQLARQLEQWANTTDSPAALSPIPDLIRRGENDRVEFKSTLRWNRQSDKADRAIEKAWLKTIVAFLNTDGGTLLVGVDDDGTVIGIDTDRFASEDKYRLHVNNRIKEHIGLDNAACIRYDLNRLGDQKVLVVQCRPSPQPVFLKMGREEEFYIRIGPGSRKLTPSEVLAYVTRRNGGRFPRP
ncbi:MAG: response regulator [Desulfobacterales bacterium]|jgi:CheY-like chemotaxis protein